MSNVPRLKERYQTQVVSALMQEFGYNNINQVPRLEKVVVNVGAGEALQNAKALDAISQDLMIITGQKPIITRARRSIAGFKLREGNPIGVKVTMRGNRMFEFMDRLINLAIPRIRDFRGLNPNSFDGRGGYSMGVSEQSIFPEINPAKVEFQQGMNITFVTTAQTDQEARRLLALFGMPFRTSSAAN